MLLFRQLLVLYATQSCRSPQLTASAVILRKCCHHLRSSKPIPKRSHREQSSRSSRSMLVQDSRSDNASNPGPDFRTLHRESPGQTGTPCHTRQTPIERDGKLQPLSCIQSITETHVFEPYFVLRSCPEAAHIEPLDKCIFSSTTVSTSLSPLHDHGNSIINASISSPGSLGQSSPTKNNS